MPMNSGHGLAAVAGFIGRRRWLPAVAWGAAILTVSSLPDLDLGVPLFPGCDKIMHFIEYSILGVGLRYWSGGARRLPLAGGVGFAAIDEFHQKYVPGRQASLLDWVADVVGVAVGLLASGRFTKKVGNG
jgi:hypothetical protein